MMTKNNSKKKAVRVRMAQANEVYSVAQRKIGLLPTSISSPWESLNSLIGGFEPGRLYTISSRPGEGRSSTSLNLATHFAATNEEAVYVNLELLKEEIRVSQSSSLTAVNMRKARMTYDNEQKLKEAHKILDMSSLVTLTRSDGYTDVDQIIDYVKARPSTKILLVDNLQLLDVEPSVVDVGLQERNTRKLKMFALEAGIPVVLMTSVNRSAPEDIPVRNMLSSEIEQSADVIIVLSNPAIYKIHVEVIKNRSGKTGEFDLIWLPDFCMIKDYTEESQEILKSVKSKAKINLTIGDRVRFIQGRNWWDVRAVSKNFAILTKPMPFKEKNETNIFYTIIDWDQEVRGAHNSYGYGIESKEDIVTMLAALEEGKRLGSGEYKDAIEVSWRNRVELGIDVVRGVNGFLLSNS